MRRLQFAPAMQRRTTFTIGDGFIVLGAAALLFAGVRLALHAPRVISGPEISLRYNALPWYAILSIGRMLGAYLLSLIFSLTYGYMAARHRTAERILMPLPSPRTFATRQVCWAFQESNAGALSSCRLYFRTL